MSFSYSRTLQFYILRETVKVFILAVLAVTLVTNFGAVLVYLHKFPLPMGFLIKVVALHVPGLFPWTCPLALLLAVTLTYGRMATDNEIMAMQASGMHMGWIVLPGVLMGLVLAGGMYLVNDRVEPACQREEYRLLDEASSSMLSMMFQDPERLGSYMHDLPYEMKWERSEGNTLYNLEVTQRDDQNRVVLTCQAARAEYHIEETTDPQTGAIKRELVLRQFDVRGTSYPRSNFRFAEQVKRIPLNNLFSRSPDNKGMNTPEMLAKLDQLRRDTAAEIVKIDGELEENTNPAAIDWLGKQKAYKLDYLRRQTNDILTRTLSRSSLAGAGLAFVLVGIPLGILTRRSHMLSAFFLASMPVLLVYYPLWLLGQTLAENQTGNQVLHVAGLVWMPTLILGMVGAALTGYLLRR